MKKELYNEVRDKALEMYEKAHILLTPAEKLQALAPPASFRAEERLCFEQCFSGLGQCEAAQECERLDYYTARFEAFLQQAQQEAAACAGLSCRLGLAAGAVLALIFL